jgi:hypothetical protein
MWLLGHVLQACDYCIFDYTCRSFCAHLILWLASWLWRSETINVCPVVNLVLLSTVHISDVRRERDIAEIWILDFLPIANLSSLPAVLLFVG